VARDVSRAIDGDSARKDDLEEGRQRAASSEESKGCIYSHAEKQHAGRETMLEAQDCRAGLFPSNTPGDPHTVTRPHEPSGRCVQWPGCSDSAAMLATAAGDGGQRGRQWQHWHGNAGRRAVLVFWAPGHSGAGGRCWLWISQGKGLECVGSFRVQRPLLLCCSAVRACRAALPLYYETHMILTPSDPSTPSRRDSDLPCSPEGVVFDRRPASVRQCSVATALCQTSDVRLSALYDAQSR
jgi:hypothetical protein